MKNKFLAMAVAAVLTAAGVAGGGAINRAEAQSAQKPPVILVVDRQQLVAQSKAGKTIPAQADAVRASVSKELEAEADKLKEDIDNYKQNASLMSDEVRQQTEKELAMRQQYGLPQRAKIMEQAFTGAIQQAENKILTEATPILKDIVEKRGATILLDRSAVMYAAVETDITQEVITQLDKKMTSVEVQKVSLAEVEKQLQEAAKAQQAAQSGKASSGKAKKK